MYSKFLKIAGLQKDAYEFLMNSRFFGSVSEEGKLRLLMSMKLQHPKAGERLITQGDEGDSLYLIQNGTCSVVVERNGELSPVAVLGPEDLAGEMAMLTGENRSAHVIAQTDMDVWRLDRNDFEKLCLTYPEIRQFLSDIITGRFSRATTIADRTIGKYLVNEVIGQGGWSVVYKGTHTTLHMPVAVKMLKHNMAMEPEFSENFLNEARTIANLNHENIVKVYDIEQLYRTIFIVMEYLEGVSLAQVLKEQARLSPGEALRILLQTCRGLAYAHAAGIVHGDIKPANIFLGKDGRAKIVDFGLACPVGTEATKVRGTPEYISPEQIQLHPADERSDIYSLGILAYRMLVGETPFQSEDLGHLLAMHLDAEMPDPRLLVADMPVELALFILKATGKNPAGRYQSVDEVIAVLLPLYQQLSLGSKGDNQSVQNMTGLFLFYRSEHGEMVKRLVGEFTEELNKLGIRHHETGIEDI